MIPPPQSPPPVFHPPQIFIHQSQQPIWWNTLPGALSENTVLQKTRVDNLKHVKPGPPAKMHLTKINGHIIIMYGHTCNSIWLFVPTLLGRSNTKQWVFSSPKIERTCTGLVTSENNELDCETTHTTPIFLSFSRFCVVLHLFARIFGLCLQ